MTSDPSRCTHRPTRITTLDQLNHSAYCMVLASRGTLILRDERNVIGNIGRFKPPGHFARLDEAGIESE